MSGCLSVFLSPNVVVFLFVPVGAFLMDKKRASKRGKSLLNAVQCC